MFDSNPYEYNEYDDGDGPSPQALVDNVPAELRALDQWVVWRCEEYVGKIVPYPPLAVATRGASLADPQTWGTFDTALAAYECGDYNGVGLVLTQGDPYVVVELHSCIDPWTRELQDWAQDIITSLDSYTELTSSEQGVCIFVQGELPPGGRKRANVEMYSERRFLPITGSHLDFTPLSVQPRGEHLALLHARIFAPDGAAAAGEVAQAAPPLYPAGQRLGAPMVYNAARWSPTPLSAIAGQGLDLDWLWAGYLAPNTLTSLAAPWKIGKTTALAHLLKALDGTAPEFCGRPVRKAKALVVSEEGEHLWAARRDELNIGDHVSLICKPFLGRPDPVEWELFVAHLAALVQAGGIDLVVFDTLQNLWSVTREEDTPRTLEALLPLNLILDKGAAVLLSFRPTRGDTSEGRLTRGMAAIGGFVDIILEMRRFDPERHEDRRRVLTSYSRFEATPPEIVIELDKAPGAYHFVGTRAGAVSADRLSTILDILPDLPPGLSAEEISERWPDHPGSTAPGYRPVARSIRRDLEQAVEAGAVQLTGSGRKSDPLRYYRPEATQALPPALGLAERLRAIHDTSPRVCPE